MFDTNGSPAGSFSRGDALRVGILAANWLAAALAPSILQLISSIDVSKYPIPVAVGLSALAAAITAFLKYSTDTRVPHS